MRIESENVMTQGGLRAPAQTLETPCVSVASRYHGCEYVIDMSWEDVDRNRKWQSAMTVCCYAEPENNCDKKIAP